MHDAVTSSGWAGRARLLALSCHPLPSVAVTVFGTALAVKAGDDLRTCVVLAGAVLLGQLSIGWSNDRIDAGRDRVVGRTGKPLVTGDLPLRVVDAAVVMALAGTVVASLALGWRPGVLHLAAVGAAWLYNLGLKATIASPLPYAAAFAALPAIATLAHTPPRWPTWWAATAGALLGVAAHLANCLPDLSGDVATGVVGFPQRFRPRTLVTATGVLLVAGIAVVTLGPGVAPPRVGVLVAAVIVTLATGRAAWRDPAGRWGFALVVGLVALDVLSLMFGPGIVSGTVAGG